ncbi:hypothetical protein OIU79_009033 [Salix purpurea]|uniref:Uncharacterized protein n=1 Tax=Salix purpurea TaxID=77065 RepID=A0A9Q0TJX6_SALPP|nr:hypothetical protein OIU79_009033 [Salix purpurea]
MKKTTTTTNPTTTLPRPPSLIIEDKIQTKNNQYHPLSSPHPSLLTSPHLQKSKHCCPKLVTTPLSPTTMQKSLSQIIKVKTRRNSILEF